MVIYCTNDLGSAHTLKRRRYFEYYKIDHKIVGILNTSNEDSEYPYDFRFRTNNASRFKYYQRVYYAYLLTKSLVNDDSEKIIFRGLEFLLFSAMLKNKYFIELTDIPNSILRSKFFRFLLRVFLRKRNLIVTSRGFLDALGLITTAKIWHNTPLLVDDTQSFEEKLQPRMRIIYAGYLRGVKELKLNHAWLYNEMDFYGKKNILSVDLSMLKENYYGEYDFKHLNKVYDKYIFSYISDFHGPNSNYSITNRLYETILNGCIPVHAKKDCTSVFMDNLGITYVRNLAEFNTFKNKKAQDLLLYADQNELKLTEQLKIDSIKLNNEIS